MESLEGHLKWIHELAPSIQKLAKGEKETLESYCAKLLKGNKSEGAFDHGWNEWSTILGKKLNKAALAVLTGNTEKASGLLDELVLILDDNLCDDVSSKKREMILYCRDVLQWQNAGGVYMGEEKRLSRKWAELEEVGGRELKALVSYFKGRLGHKLKIEGEKITEYHLEAHRLDPGCLAWYHHAFHSVRKDRRNARMKLSGLPERVLAEKAYYIGNSGEDLIAAADYGLMLKEYLRATDENINPNRYLECVQVFEEGLARAEGFTRMKMRVYLAEFLYFGEGPQIDKNHGRYMLVDLEKEYPNSVSVLHKVGKMYFEEGKWERATECYKRALAMDPTAMPCIMDYLKLLKGEMKGESGYWKEQSEAEMMRVLKKALSPEYVMEDNSIKTLQDQVKKLVEGKRETEADKDNDWRRK